MDVFLNMCYLTDRVKMNSSVGMIVVDISLLSGLRANTGDLEHVRVQVFFSQFYLSKRERFIYSAFLFYFLQLMKGSEQFIDRYDVHQNKVFLYFAKVNVFLFLLSNG